MKVDSRISGRSALMGILSFVIVLLMMPLGHALMILMEHLLTRSQVNVAALCMAIAGLALTLGCTRLKSDTAGTVAGLTGGLLFWTGGVEFLYVYFAHKLSVAPLTDNGVVVTKPEYLLMPSSAAFLLLVWVIYIWELPSGCPFFTFLRKHLASGQAVTARKRSAAVVTFMELNVIMWSSYIVLLLCYDSTFGGDHSWLTLTVAGVCLGASVWMFRNLLRLRAWGYSLRYATATVIIFWTFVEVMGRLNIMEEIWVRPLEYALQMSVIAGIFIIMIIFAYINGRRHNRK
ncbi:MAG: hypothetical protein K2M79_07165 [Muribaculaceae bacterium]|nr:hypothetical protein [Muribaculaceae bacterium]